MYEVADEKLMKEIFDYAEGYKTFIDEGKTEREACAFAVEAAKKAKVPIVFVHGDCDDFVPHEMSVEMYEACTAPCRMITIKGAGHGLAYPADREGYLAALDAACKELGIFEKE